MRQKMVKIRPIKISPVRIKIPEIKLPRPKYKLNFDLIYGERVKRKK